MRQRKLERSNKRQRGQFLTPAAIACGIVKSVGKHDATRILEPSCGDGSFLAPILQNPNWRQAQVVGIEIEPELAQQARETIAISTGNDARPRGCQVHEGDFFQYYLDRKFSKPGAETQPLAEAFDLVIGNPPFGGSFNPEIEDHLDAELGTRLGKKIKKETYAFFLIACAELLRPGGRLVFICSDSLMTIPTMTGLRAYLMETGEVTLHELNEFSDETTYPMLVIEYVRGQPSDRIHRFGQDVCKSHIEATPNLSWGIDPATAQLFSGPKLGDLFFASSGMTTGKNKYFVRDILPGQKIEEPYAFSFQEEPVTLSGELERARLNKLSPKKIAQLREVEARGDTQRRLSVEPRDTPLVVQLPHPDYAPYNKANGRIIYSDPTHVIYWKDEGDAVITYKKTGNWYLRGVGGMPYFGKEGLTWQLISSRFNARYLPSGYILDSGGPCAFPREGVNQSEIYFVIGWLLTPLANKVLKQVINHTRNIQSKDFERMPYPWWVSENDKETAIERVKALIEKSQSERTWSLNDDEVQDLLPIYNYDADQHEGPSASGRESELVGQANLFGG